MNLVLSLLLPGAIQDGVATRRILDKISEEIKKNKVLEPRVVPTNELP